MQKAKKIKNNSTFGWRLRKVRKGMGLTQTEFAKKLGFSANTIISRFERDKGLPTVETLFKLAENTDIDFHWLLTGLPSPGDRELKEAYRTILGRLAKYISRGLAQLLSERDSLSSELIEVKKRQARGETVEQEFIEQLEAEITQTQAVLSELAQDQPWVQEAIEAFTEQK